MDVSPFDRLVTALSSGVSRRQAAQLLAGSTSGGVGMAAVSGRIAAKKGKGKGKKCPKSPKCPRGKLLATITVPANGEIVQTLVLESGQLHRLRAAGFWALSGVAGVDAFAAFVFQDPGLTNLFIDGARAGLSVDGGSPDEWGKFNPNHVYELEVKGSNKRLTLRRTDPDTLGISTSVTVDVFCA